MTDKNEFLRAGLNNLGLSEDEVEIYLALLRQPSTTLRLSNDTSIPRTKVYRIIETLTERGLVASHTDDKGVFLVASDPKNLGIGLAMRENKLKEDQVTFTQLLPMLTAMQGSDQLHLFAVRTYDGYAGFRQMCWHELKAKGEVLSFGGCDLEELIPNRLWSQRHRDRSVEAGYRVREIINSETDLPTYIDNQEYMEQYSCRGISARIVPLANQIIIYNDTVAIYHWRQRKKVGVEIISHTYANTMRAIFEQYWRMAEPKTSRPL